MKDKNKKSEHMPEYNFRRSQLITPFGIGALVDVNNTTLMISDSDFWQLEECNTIHDVRLEKAMNAVDFIEPPVSEEGCISGRIFPEWYYSPKDRLIQSITKWRQLAEIYSKNSRLKEFDRRPFDARPGSYGAELISARIICVCPNGHVQDFPWLDWPHEGMKKTEYATHHVTLNSSAANSKFSDYMVRCQDCKKSRKLNVFNPKIFQENLNAQGIKCNGRFVWKKNELKQECDAPLQVVMKSATNLYFANIISSVNIPFVENQILETVQSASNSDYEKIAEKVGILSDSVDRVNVINKDKEVYLRMLLISDKCGFSVDEIKTALIKKYSDSNKINSTMEYRREEFDVLTGRTKYKNANDRFQIQRFDNLEYEVTNEYTRLIDEITLVHQLEVVNVLRGYSRIKPTDNEQIKEMALEGNEDTDIGKEVSLRRKDGRYVGMSNLGEGFFIKFSTERILKWLNQNSNSDVFKVIQEKKRQIAFEDDLTFIDPAYYLLHTISHLIIRELNLNSGYTSSSLKERLYFSNREGEEPMFGVLIYTSSSDSEGTLGGLVRQGIPRNFFKLLTTAVEKAKWCSFDPICIESKGQGRNSLNGAACHACTLVAETSCEKMNLFLDRRVVIGSYSESNVGFFN